MALTGACAGWVAERAEAQGVVRQRPAQQRAPVQGGRPVLPTGPMLIETSAPILNLLGRAEEGISRADWKLAIDSLQRVIEDPEGALVEREDEGESMTPLYESARRQATRRLATLPAEGLAAYRVLYDGKAKGMFDRARAAHDANVLREVAERYLLTTVGDDASEVLASWELDLGRPGRALALLIDVREIVPDSDVPRELIDAKLVAAYALLGQAEQAAGVLKSAQDGKNPTWFAALSNIAPSGPAIRPGDDWSELLAMSVSHSAMPAVEPTLATTSSSFLLSGATSNWRDWLSEDEQTASLHLPPDRLASDGRRVFVRKPGGCAALDADDLSVLWDSTATESGGVLRRVRSYTTSASGRTEDEIGQAVTVAHGLVLFIERGEVDQTLDALRAQQFQPNMPIRTGVSRLVALRAEDGRVAWQRASGGDAADLLNGANFRHPPIGVGDELWMPYYKAADLFFAILDPRNGTLKRSVLLGSAREVIDPLGPAIPPMFADGVVFLPAGGSTLFAVDAFDHTVRWARQYDRNSRGRVDLAAVGRGWAATSPIVRGGNVLLAASDQPDLLAFSAVSGETRWASALEGANYIIAADTERVWIGGRNISCVSVVSGESIWSTRLVKAPSGRAAMCGDRLFAPTTAGMLMLDAADGSSLGIEAPPADGKPLGNLACSQSALFSVEFDAVRKFPDIERTYELAAKRHRARPDDAEATLRLASAELLKNQPEAAWELASSIPDAAFVDRFAERSRLAGLKVEAALRLSRKFPPGSAESLARLEDARRATASPDDELRTGFAVADHFVAAGQIEKAHDVLWTLGTREVSASPFRLAEDVSVSARLEIARRLAEVTSQVPAAVAVKLSGKAETALQSILAQLSRPDAERDAAKQLASLGQLDRKGAVGARALLAAAQWERKRSAFERSELLLDEFSAKDDPLLAAAAMVERCSLYDWSALGWFPAMDPCLRELEAKFGAVSPPTLAGVTSRVPAGRTVADWVAAQRTNPSAVPSPFDFASSSVALTSESAWSRLAQETAPQVPAGRMVLFEPDGSAILGDRVVTFRQDGTLECIGAGKGDTLWHTELRLPGDFPQPFSPRTNNPQASELLRSAVADGQVAVFNHDDALYAVGLLTGRRLWAHPLEVVDLPGAAVTRDGAMAAGDGFLAAMPNDGKLALLRMLDGSLLWERDLRGESVNHIWMDGDRVVTVNGISERVNIFDRADGHLVRQALFDQPGGGSPMIHLVRAPGFVIGPQVVQMGSSVFAVNTENGETTWSMALDLPLLQMFKPAEGYVGLGLGQGVVRILDAKTGEVVLERTVPGGRTVTAGVLFDANFIVRTDGARGGKQTVELSAFDVATGESLWHRADIGGIVSNAEMIPLLGGVIPVLTEAVQSNVTPSGAAMPSYRPTLAFVDARTGGNAGQAIDLSSISSGTRFTGDVMLKGGALLVGSNRGISAFRTRPVTRAEGGKDF